VIQITDPNIVTVAFKRIYKRAADRSATTCHKDFQASGSWRSDYKSLATFVFND
jgi:hypothetical protein